MLATCLLFLFVSNSIFASVAENTSRDEASTPNNCGSTTINNSAGLKISCKTSPEQSLLERIDQNTNTERKIKIAIVGCISIGHITPTIEMVRALKSKGHEIVHYAPIYTKKLIEATGVKFIAYPEQKEAKVAPVDIKTMSQNETGLLMMAWFGSFTEYIMPWFIENFKNEEFDVVIYSSLSMWGNTLASYFNIPKLCLGISVYPAEEKAWIDTHFYDERLDKQLEFVDELHRKYNTTAKTLTEFLSCSGDKKILMFSSQKFLEAAFGQSFLSPEKYIFLNSLSTQTSKNFISEIKENSIIYLSLGTAFNDRPDIFESIINVFSKTKYELIVSTGTNENTYQILMSKYRGNSNVKINLYVNQPNLLKEVAVFITHGGLNSIKDAITNTIPTITIPQGADQYLLSKAITNLKIGVTVEDYQGSFEEKIQAAFQEIEKSFLVYKENLKIAQKHYFDGTSFDESILDLEDYLFSIMK